MEERQSGEMTETEKSPEAKKPKSKKKYVLMVFLLMFVATLAAAAYLYYRGIVYYRTHFSPIRV